MNKTKQQHFKKEDGMYFIYICLHGFFGPLLRKIGGISSTDTSTMKTRTAVEIEFQHHRKTNGYAN